MDYVALSNLHTAASRGTWDARQALDAVKAERDERERMELERSERQARVLRRKGWTVAEVSDFLGVSEYRVRKVTANAK